MHYSVTLRSQLSNEGDNDDDDGRPRVYLGRLSIDDMLTDAFGPILREGGKEIEVSLRLTNTLSAMQANLPAMSEPIEGWAARHAKRVRETMEDPDDLTVFQRTYARLWPTLA